MLNCPEGERVCLSMPLAPMEVSHYQRLCAGVDEVNDRTYYVCVREVLRQVQVCALPKVVESYI